MSNRENIKWLAERIAGLLYFFAIAVIYGLITGETWHVILFSFIASGVAIGLFLIFCLLLFAFDYLWRKKRKKDIIKHYGYNRTRNKENNAGGN